MYEEISQLNKKNPILKSEQLIHRIYKLPISTQKKCTSSSSAIREMQIKNTMSYHFTPTRMAINKDSNKC